MISCLVNKLARYIVTATLILLIAPTSQAASVLPAFIVGLNIWGQNLSGDVEYQGDSADTETDFGIKDPEESIKFYFETRDILPFLPNFRAYYDRFRYEARTSQIYNFGSQPFAENAKVVIGSETFGLTVFYGRDFFGILEGSAGFDLRNVSFDITLSGFHANNKNDLEVTFSGTKEVVSFIPMFFSRLLVSVPIVELFAYVEGYYAKLEDNLLVDYRAAVGATIFYDIKMAAGYRTLDYKVKNSTKGTNINLIVSGTYIELSYDL